MHPPPVAGNQQQFQTQPPMMPNGMSTFFFY
jgi:hypothetical protein